MSKRRTAAMTADTSRSKMIEDTVSSDRQLQLLVSAVTDYAIFMLDPGGHVRSWNAGARRLKGYATEEILGAHLSHFYTEKDRAAGAPGRALEIARAAGRFETEGWRVRKDGSRFWANAVIDAIYDEDGTVVGFAKITRDVTERMETQKALEQTREALHQSQKMEAIGQLTGGVAHDFNNLLAVVIGNLDLIAKDIARGNLSRLERLSANALRAARRDASLTQQLLAFSRRQPLNPRTIDLNKSISDFQPMLQRACGETIRVRLNLDPGAWPAHLDPTHFEAALLNLVLNSRDAMPQGGVVTITTGNVDLSPAEASAVPDLGPGAYVRVIVQDMGTGMSDDVLRRALEPFFTTKEVGKGSGLGLAQVYGFVRQSHGQVVIKSDLGVGTRVHLYLPRSDEPPVQETQATRDLVEPVLKEVVLAVEDDPDVLEIVVESLRDLGYEVVTASDGPHALSVLRNGRIDWLFTDVVMPNGMSGVDLAYEARGLWPDLRILLTSGYADVLLRQQTLPTDFQLLAKPYSQSELAEKLRGRGRREQA